MESLRGVCAGQVGSVVRTTRKLAFVDFGAVTVTKKHRRTLRRALYDSRSAPGSSTVQRSRHRQQRHRQQHALGTPGDSLPNEVLDRIMTAVLTDCYCNPMATAHVCRSWRASTARCCWARIDLTPNSPAAAWARRRDEQFAVFAREIDLSSGRGSWEGQRFVPSFVSFGRWLLYMALGAPKLRAQPKSVRAVLPDLTCHSAVAGEFDDVQTLASLVRDAVDLKEVSIVVRHTCRQQQHDGDSRMHRFADLFGALCGKPLVRCDISVHGDLAVVFGETIVSLVNLEELCIRVSTRHCGRSATLASPKLLQAELACYEAAISRAPNLRRLIVRGNLDWPLRLRSASLTHVEVQDAKTINLDFGSELPELQVYTKQGNGFNAYPYVPGTGRTRAQVTAVEATTGYVQRFDVSGVHYLAEVLTVCCPKVDLSRFVADSEIQAELMFRMRSSDREFVHNSVRAEALAQQALRGWSEVENEDY